MKPIREIVETFLAHYQEDTKRSHRASDEILSSVISSSRILRPDPEDPKTLDKEGTLRALDRHLDGFGDLPEGIGLTPREFLKKKKPERCPITGEALDGPDNECLSLGLKWGEADRTKFRVIFTQGYLGDRRDAARSAEGYISGNTDTREWRVIDMALRSVPKSKFAEAESFLSWENPRQSFRYKAQESLPTGGVYIGGDVVNSSISTGARNLWEDKLSFLYQELAMASDPNIKHSILCRIREAKAMLG